METVDLQINQAIRGRADAKRIIRGKIESFLPGDPLLQVVVIPEIKIFIDDREFGYENYREVNFEELEPIQHIRITYPVIEDIEREIDYHCVRCVREII
ncbi:MAG: hypothetical protein ACFFCS_02240 [Candidatus Hodarchaeota archaeon]